jgi:hypothetical protein
MNSIFHEKLGEFMIIYIDDILLYSKMVKKHMQHLEYVLSKLPKNKINSLPLGEKWVCLRKDGLLGAYLIKGRGEAWP